MKRTPLLAHAVLAFALLSGCTTIQPDPEPGASPDPEMAPSRPGVSVAELVASGEGGASALDRLGPPVRADAEPFENLHVPGQVDTLRTLHYDGLRVGLYDVSGSPRVLLQSITVTGHAYDTGLGFGVGASRAEVEAALGPPDERFADAYAYVLSEGGADNALIVRFAGGRVRELEWGFYVD